MLKALTLTAVIAPAALVAQAPQQPFGDRLKAAWPEVNQLQEVGRFPEALARLEAALGTGPEAWDKANLQTARESFIRYRVAVDAYLKAYPLAWNAGQWEKALELAQKAVALAKENQENTKANLSPASDNLKAMAAALRSQAKEDEEYVAQLKAKTNPDDADRQQLDLVAARDKDIANNEFWSKQLLQDVDTASKEYESYKDLATQIQDGLTQESDALAKAPYKGDKTKYVAAATATPSNIKVFLDRYPDAKARLGALYRLQAQDPSNKKVKAEIERMLGRVGTEAKQK